MNRGVLLNISTVLKVLFGLFFIVVISGVLYLRLGYPKYRVASAEPIERTEERVDRGKYLVESVLNCYGCHSVRDYTFYSGPTKPETQGQGAECFDDKVGFPGKVCAQNITPDRETGLGDWTDGEVMRAIREGVSRDGRALFPMMPYKTLRQLSDTDTQAVVAYPTAYHALREAGFAQGKTVLVTGVGGSVGNAAVQLATALGAGKVISTDSWRTPAATYANGMS